MTNNYENSDCKERFGWTKYSESRLIEVERKILEAVKTIYRTWFVKVETSLGEQEKIWTIVLNEGSKNTPLVLLHGFAAGICFWCPNFDSVSKDRPVYALDLLGFGRSSRPNFSNDPLEAEQQMVESLEKWRKEVNIERFILLGHSFGGYLATSYAINYPNRVKHLILADPWGFTEQPANPDIPVRYKLLGILFYPFTYFNPLAAVRAVGPIGPWLISKVRNDISSKYGSMVDNKDLFAEYLYHCNSQKPSGETAFQCMKKGFGWAKNPMIGRFGNLKQNIPVTVLYGKDSWLKKISEDVFKEKRPNSYFNIKLIDDSGHHVNADQPSLFNEAVNIICKKTDGDENNTFQENGTENNLDKVYTILYPDEEIPTIQITNKKL